MTGTVAHGEVYVVANGASNNVVDITDEADQLQGIGLNWFSGNDAVVLKKNGVMIDSIGRIGEDPASGEWGTGAASTKSNSLRRVCSIAAGDPDTLDPFDPTDEWDGFSVDNFNGLGRHELCSVGLTDADINSERIHDYGPGSRRGERSAYGEQPDLYIAQPIRWNGRSLDRI